MRTPLLLCLASLAAAAPLCAQTDAVQLRRALRLHREVPMIDGHNDLPWKLRAYGRDSFQPGDASRPRLSLDSVDIARPQPALMTDIPRLRAGRVGGQFWSLWIPNELVPAGSARTTLEQIDIARRLAERYPHDLLLATSAADVWRAHRTGRIATLMGIEGGHAIENSLPVLRAYAALGVRYMTLTHNTTLAWVDAVNDSARHHGLTPFGREVVREMNRLGVLVDLAHVSDSVAVQAIRLSEAPVIFSHSAARALADHPRNVPDEILRMLPQNGGVVMVNFYCDFVDSARVRYNRERRAQRSALQDRHGADTAAVRQGLQAWEAAHPVPPAPTLAAVADHIDHVRQVAGIDHVGYGSDFDGIDCAPTGLEDVSDFPRLTAELLRRGYSDEDAKKVIGLNILRVLRQAELVAARLQRERGPSTATLAQLDSTGVRP
jgi:membrane dipeptidase